MNIIFGTTQVTAACTRVQLQNTADDVIWFKAHARFGNTGRMFLGLVDVAATVNGWEFEIPVAASPLAEFVLPIPQEGAPKGRSFKLNILYADSTVNGERLDWIAIVK